ncbi:MAG TPA: SUMF1/EgtB/PvdO family nonheme iron enzyme [Polyangiaceae bacterium]|nr:SUMF1/EgtB/PvdO family nonheme iron enzyme [Polyangiaceae bacterium]
MADPADRSPHEKGEPRGLGRATRNVAPWGAESPAGGRASRPLGPATRDGLGARPAPRGAAGRPPSDARPRDSARPRHGDATPFEGTRTLEEPRRQRVRILFVSADASPERRLQTDREFRAIDGKLEAAEYGGAFRLVPCLAAHIDDLRRHLLKYKPDIVHFAGHGDGEGGLRFLDDKQRPVAVRVEALASIVQACCDEVRLVVFNACFSAEQADALRRRVGLAVGMRGGVDDGAAIAFAGAFYEALGHGRSVRAAFEAGVGAAKAVDASPGAMPRLLERHDVRAEDTAFAEPSAPPQQPSGHDLGPVGRAKRLEAALHGRAIALALALSASGAVALAPVSKLFSNPLPPLPLSAATDPVAATPPAPWPFEARSRALPSPSEASPAPRSVAIRGARVELGAIDKAARPAECIGPGGDDDCTSSTCPGWGHAIEVAGFSLDATEVTNEDFARWLEAHSGTWHLAKGGPGVVLTNARPHLALASDECGGLFVEGGRVRVRPGHGRRPASCVTWQGANDYCRAQGKRLPTDAEWELAAKGLEGRPFPWGLERPRPEGVAFGGRGGALGGARDVATSAHDRTPEGIFDLGGNVSEWTASDDGAGRKALRGGSWASTNACSLLSSGAVLRPSNAYGPDVGFRCASDAR